MTAYRIATDEEKVGKCSDQYDLLLGPDGWDCYLGEPEDRTWERDAAAVVDLLNSQHAEIERLETALDDMWKRYRRD